MTTEIKATVKHLLETVPSLRDSDERLVANFWYYELKNKFNHSSAKLIAHDFFTMYADGEMTTADVITRARRLLQQLHPELRGKTWEARQKKAGETREKFRELI